MSSAIGNPLVSIVMPAYKTARYLRAAIDSALAQTYPHLELLVIDDGSPDEVAPICRSYPDPRVRLIALPVNRGQAAARNAGLEQARGDYIAFLDSDDVAVPERLELQLEHFRRFPECGLLGGAYRRMSEDGRVLPGVSRFDLPPGAIRPMLMLRNYFNMSTVTLPRTALPPGGFRPMFAEDYDFIARVAETPGLGLANLAAPLAHYRINPTSLSNTTGRPEVRDALWTIQDACLRRLGLHAAPDEREVHQSITFAMFDGLSVEKLGCADRWLRRILEANEASGTYATEDLTAALGEVWFRLCYASVRDGPAVLRAYWSGQARRLASAPVSGQLRMAVKALMRRGYVAKPTRLGVK